MSPAHASGAHRAGRRGAGSGVGVSGWWWGRLLPARVGSGALRASDEAEGADEAACTELEAGARGTGPTGARALTDPHVITRLRALDPARTNRSTPRDMTRLLGAVWRDEACPPEYGAAVRRVLGLQVWPHRLASGFPFDDVHVAGNTGSLPTLRNEVGVVEYPDGGRFAVAVFTRTAHTAAVLPAADAVIGTAARIAVDALRAD